MPIYEYFCPTCSKRVEIFRRSISAVGPDLCPNCGGADLKRLVSKFAVHRSFSEFGSEDEESYIDGLESGDPRAMAAWARRMGEESGESMDPEFNEMVSRMEAGGMPDGGFGDDDDGMDDFDL